MSFELFISYSRRDNERSRITTLNTSKCLEEIGPYPLDLEKEKPYLVFVNLNTTGLQSGPMGTSDPEDHATHNVFYWFVHIVGRTGQENRRPARM